MSDILELQKEIAASLYMKPATLAELMSRDFLKNRSEEGVDRLLMAMENKNWIFCKSEVYHTRPKFAKSKEMKEYELAGSRANDLKYKRPTIEQVVKRWKRGQF